MTTEIITLDGLREVTLTPAARQRRNMLLAQSSGIESVSAQEDNERAAFQQSELRELRLETEKARKALKAPITALGRKIEDVSSEFLGPVEAEEQRLAKLCGDWIQLQLASAKSAHSASNDRLTDYERRRAAALAEAVSHDQRDAINAEFDDLARSEQAKQMALLPPKAEGQQVKGTWEFEVIDALAMANARPDLVRIEPKRREVLEALTQGFRVAGIRAWKTVKVGMR